MRTLSTNFRNAVEASSTSDNGIALATVTGAMLAAPVYWSSDNCDYLYNGNRYVGVSFGLSLLTDADAPPKGQASVMNVDRKVGEAVLGIIDSPSIAIIIVSRAEFGPVDASNLRSPLGTPSIEYSAQNLQMQNIHGDAMQVTFDLVLRDYATEQWPGKNASQSSCPGLYR